MKFRRKIARQLVNVRRIGLSLVGLCCLATGTAHAAPYMVTAQIHFLRSHDQRFGVDMDWFALAGVTSLATCPAHSGYVVFRIKDTGRGQRHFSMLLAAKTAGQAITVSVDDSFKDPNGYCWVDFIHM